MQVRRAELREVPSLPFRSGPQSSPRRRPINHPVAGGFALLLALLLAAPPASPSAMTTLSGEAPAAEGDRPAPDPAPATGSQRHRAVFVCREDGVPVFTDRPCGTATGQRTLTIDPPAPGAAPSTPPPRPPASTRPRPQPDGQAGTGRAPDTRCATLQRQLVELDERMRAGYSSREAARLWNRWRDLKGRLRSGRC